MKASDREYLKELMGSMRVKDDLPSANEAKPIELHSTDKSQLKAFVQKTKQRRTTKRKSFARTTQGDELQELINSLERQREYLSLWLEHNVSSPDFIKRTTEYNTLCAKIDIQKKKRNNLYNSMPAHGYSEGMNNSIPNNKPTNNKNRY